MTERQQAIPSLKHERWLQSQALQRLFDALEVRGAARVAGGAVRDALLGRPVADVDIATTLTPEQVMEALDKARIKAVPTGIDHGTVTAVAGGKPGDVYQVTTLRVDVETFGRHARVAFTDDWAADAARRDFTMNALYCDRNGDLYDPLGGYADLAARRVRFVGDARARIREDNLRILRFFRFTAVFGGSGFDAEGLDACVELRAGLDGLSRERVNQEFLRLLAAEGAVPTISVMSQKEILSHVLPQAWDVERLARLCAIEATCGRAPDALLRLAALALHEAGDVEALHDGLKLTNVQTARLALLAGERPRLRAGLSEGERKECLYRMGSEAFCDAVLFDWAASPQAADDRDWRELLAFAGRWRPPVFPLKGSDLKALGVARGPEMGVLLRRAEQWWIDRGFPEDETLVRAYLEELVADCDKSA